VAAEYLLKEKDYNIKKIAILDWDAHHGDSTQKLFYENPNVLYISTHNFQNGAFYPFSDRGDFQYCGEKEGLGYNLNFPFNHDMSNFEKIGD